jgi:hypothetical protein
MPEKSPPEAGVAVVSDSLPMLIPEKREVLAAGGGAWLVLAGSPILIPEKRPPTTGTAGSLPMLIPEKREEP